MSIDDTLAASPFTKDGLDRDLLARLQNIQGVFSMQTGWPTRDRTERGFFWVAFWNRPTPASRPDLSDRELTRMQEQWDAAAGKFRNYLEGHRERTEIRRTSEYVRQQEIVAKDLADLKAELRTGYFSVAGATESGFEAALPDLMEELRRQAALTGAVSPSAKSPISFQEIIR